MRKIIALCLVMLMLAAAACAEGEGFVFRNGVTWGMSREEVLVSEMPYEADDLDEYTDDIGTYSLQGVDLEDVTAAGVEADAHYVFMNGALIVCGYTFESEDISMDQLTAALSARYGESRPMDLERAQSGLGVLYADVPVSQMFEDATVLAWDAPQTYILLVDMDYGEFTVAYVGEAEIARQVALSAEEAPAAQPNTDGL